MNRNILHIDMDAFFVGVERVVNPKLIGRPVIVGGTPEQRGVVASASYEARKFGVHSAMPTAAALKLCPEAIVVSGSMGLYGRASKAVMHIVKRYAPVIEPVSVDECYADMTGTKKLFGDTVDIGAKMLKEIKNELRLEATVGVAGNRLVSKVASQMAKPKGLMEVMLGFEGRFLAPLKVKRLPGVGPATAKRLNYLNIHKLGELADINISQLRIAFGRVIGYLLHLRSNGIDDTPVFSRENVKSVGHEVTFTSDTGDLDELLRRLCRLVERGAFRLRKLGVAAKTVSVKIRYADFVDVAREVTVQQVTDIDTELAFIAKNLLKSMYTRRTLVRLIGVRFSNLTGFRGQMLLFDPNGINRKGILMQTVDTVRDCYGFEAIRLGIGM